MNAIGIKIRKSLLIYPTLNPSPQARRDLKTVLRPFLVYGEGVGGWGKKGLTGCQCRVFN